MVRIADAHAAQVKHPQQQETVSALTEQRHDLGRLPVLGAVESGLPAFGHVQATLLRLAEPKQLCSINSNRQTRPYLSFSAGIPESYTASQHAEFIREFSTDVAELKLRINRLKLRVAKIALRGSDYRDISYEREQVEDALERLSTKAFEASRFGFRSDQDESQLIADYNRAVPEAFRIESSPLLSSYDAELISRVSGSIQFYKDVPSRDELGSVDLFLERIGAIGRQLRNIEQAPLLFTLTDEKNDHQVVLRSTWRRYRELVRELSVLEEHGNWCSPGYGESLEPQRGTTQHSEPFKTDYQRFKNPVVEKVDGEAHKVFFRDTSYDEYAATTLFPNGLAALEAVFLLIAHDMDRGRRTEGKPIVLSGRDLYGEVKDSIFGFCHRTGFDHKEIPSYDTDTLINAIKEDTPCAVVLEPLANSYDMRVTEVKRVLEALRDWDWRKDSRFASHWEDRDIYLVIDSTTLGPQALWKQCALEDLPPFIRVVNIESLIKYGEDGQDLTGAAVVTLAGRFSDSGFKNIRSRRGFMPPESVARRVDFSLDREALDRRLARHSRNTEIVARSLTEHAVSEGGFLDRPCHPLLAEHPDHEAFASEAGGSGSLLSVGFRYSLLKDYRELHGEPPNEWQDRPMSIDNKERIAKAYSTLVTQLAGDIGLDLVLGTSFGFNTSRIAVYTRQLSNEEHALVEGHREAPYLRVASGTETIKDVVLFTAVLKRADEIFSQAIRARKVGQLSDVILKRQARLVSGSVI